MIFLPGGLSAVDSFDYKPALEKHHGQATQGENTVTPFNGKRGTVMQSPGHFVSEDSRVSGSAISCRS